MKPEYILSFDGIHEHSETADAEQRGRIGTALLSFLTLDLSSACHRLERSLNTGNPIRAEISLLYKKFASSHPFSALLFKSAFSSMENSDSVLRFLKALQSFQRMLYRVADNLFLDEETPLSSLQRLCILCCSDAATARQFGSLRDYVRTERRFFVSGKEIRPQFCTPEELEEPCEIQSRLCFVTDSFQAILLTEIQQMAEQNVILRKCANCGGLFIPYSGKTIYCDRRIPGLDKTCKEYAAKEKYQKKIASDEALSLFRRRSKTFSMRVLRSGNPDLEGQYALWKRHAEESLSRYQAGELSFSAYNSAISLPKIEKYP